MPNLVVISLDGVSQLLFWQYREAMPFLWELSNHSAMFRHFYSASTSAFQSFCDLVHGDAGELDHNIRYPDRSGCLAGRSANLFGILRDRGYEVMGIQHGNPVPAYAAGSYWGAWPESCGCFRCHSDYAAFNADADAFLERAAAEGKPFTLYYNDRVGKPDDESPEKDSSLFHERFSKGFSLMDGSAKRLFDKLASLNLLAGTVVVVYGPYGLDPWKHGIFRGRTHATDPYADLCWTPLFIYNNGNEANVVDQLVSVVDLKPTLLHMLFPNIAQTEASSMVSGVDILRYQRQTALTQNLFALEAEGEGPARGLCKSYAATDGDQRLIVTSERGIHGDGGLELYYDIRDPANTRNFLDFFTLDPSGEMSAFGRPDIIHPHFIMSFKRHLVMSVVEAYNRMREQLHGFIRFKEQQALQLAGKEGERNLFPDDAFKHPRRRR